MDRKFKTLHPWEKENIHDKINFGTTQIRVEKYQELYSAGIGNDAVNKIIKRGYNYRQIAQKLGQCPLYEIRIGDAEVPYVKLNIGLNEGLTQMWD